MRLFLAIQCFFALLFGGKLPPKALPAPEESEEKRLEREALSKELETAKASAKTLEEQVEELKAAKEAAAWDFPHAMFCPAWQTFTIHAAG